MSAPRPGARGPGRAGRGEQEAPAESWMPVTHPQRSPLSWVGWERRLRRGAPERRRGQRGSRGEGGRRGAQTRPRQRGVTPSGARFQNCGGTRGVAAHQGDGDSGSERSPRGFPPRRRSGAHAPLLPSPRPLLARRRRGSRGGAKWRAMAAPPRSTGLADGAPFSPARAGQRLECTK